MLPVSGSTYSVLQLYCAEYYAAIRRPVALFCNTPLPRTPAIHYLDFPSLVFLDTWLFTNRVMRLTEVTHETLMRLCHDDLVSHICELQRSDLDTVAAYPFVRSFSIAVTNDNYSTWTGTDNMVNLNDLTPAPPGYAPLFSVNMVVDTIAARLASTISEIQNAGALDQAEAERIALSRFSR
jgi:hypothetical protein